MLTRLATGVILATLSLWAAPVFGGYLKDDANAMPNFRGEANAFNGTSYRVQIEYAVFAPRHVRPGQHHRQRHQLRLHLPNHRFGRQLEPVVDRVGRECRGQHNGDDRPPGVGFRANGTDAEKFYNLPQPGSAGFLFGANAKLSTSTGPSSAILYFTCVDPPEFRTSTAKWGVMPANVSLPAPEPATLCLLAAGMSTIICRRRETRNPLTRAAKS